MGAGQQSRVDCVKLAARKASVYFLRQVRLTLSHTPCHVMSCVYVCMYVCVAASQGAGAAVSVEREEAGPRECSGAVHRGRHHRGREVSSWVSPRLVGCMYICMHVCMYTPVCISVYICMHACMYVYACIMLCVYIRMYLMCEYVYMLCLYVMCVSICLCNVCMYVCMYVCM